MVHFDKRKLKGKNKVHDGIYLLLLNKRNPKLLTHFVDGTRASLITHYSDIYILESEIISNENEKQQLGFRIFVQKGIKIFEFGL